MKEIFENYIETSFDGFQQATFKLKQFELNYYKYLKHASNALDIGVGRGEMLTCMKKLGLNYQGVDISPSTIRLCTSLGLDCHLTKDTVSWLNDRESTFDVITCLDVLEHVPRDQTIAFASAIRNSLTDNGLAIIQVPNLQSPYGYLHHFNDFTHVSGFVEHSLSQVLLAAGFKKFNFYGFEEITTTGIKPTIRKIFRHIYWKCVHFLRTINTNPNPEILNPVMYVIAYK